VSDPEQTIRPDFSHPYLPGRKPTYPLLRVLSGPLEGREFTLTAERYTVGREAQSDIVIAQPEVSRRHAEIMRMASEYVLIDLKSANGIFVNNLKLDRAVLYHGDAFQIGSCVFQFIWNRNEPSTP
jgi:S-DNA-T family DNA segregation ATPase FtsK/SpoIIIE